MTDIKQRIAGYTRNVEQMRLANRYLKFGDDEALLRIGFSLEQIKRLKVPDASGRIGFQPVLLKRASQKIYDLKKRQAAIRAAGRKEQKQ